MPFIYTLAFPIPDRLTCDDEEVKVDLRDAEWWIEGDKLYINYSSRVFSGGCSHSVDIEVTGTSTLPERPNPDYLFAQYYEGVFDVPAVANVERVTIKDGTMTIECADGTVRVEAKESPPIQVSIGGKEWKGYVKPKDREHRCELFDKW